MSEKPRYQMDPTIAQLLRDVGMDIDDAAPEIVTVPADLDESQGGNETGADEHSPESQEPPDRGGSSDEPSESAMVAMIRPVEPKDYIEPAWAKYLFRIWDHVDDTPGVLASGPRGTGKTLAAMVYAARRNRPLLICNCNPEMSPDSLLGTARLNLKDKGGDYLQPGPIALAAKHDAILLLDEFNLLGPAVQATLNPLTDAVQKGIFMPYTGERLEWHKPRIIAAINEGYAGTREIQPALRDRFEPIFAEYLPEADEVRLLVKRTKCAKDLAERAVKTANAIRAAAKGDDGSVMPIDFDLSLRALLSFARRVVNGQQTEAEAWNEAVIGRVGYNMRSQGTREAVKQLSNQIGGFTV